MARITSITHRRGGVGKTTTTINLAVGLALSGRRTLVVDVDPLAAATRGFGLAPLPSARDLRFWIDDRCAAEPVPAGVPRLDILRAGLRLADLEPILWRRPDRMERLRKALAPLEARYDRILIDCPPGQGLFTLAAWVAGQSALIPLRCDHEACTGLTQMLEMLRGLAKRSILTCETKVLITMYEPGIACAAVEAEIRSRARGQVLATVIPRDEALVEAARSGRSVFHQQSCARATRAFVELAREVISHERQ
jgi:chromosome partitioning protein